MNKKFMFFAFMVVVLTAMVSCKEDKSNEPDPVPIETVKTINITTAGSLSTALTDAEKLVITSLTVTGTIDARDFKIMRDDMPLLASIDLSGANIAAFSGTGGTDSNSSATYAANMLPYYAFNQYTFSGVTRPTLTSVVLPTSLTAIGYDAFFYCNKITSITIPNGVTTIGSDAFISCSGMTSITIPNSVTSIGSWAFFRCSKLTSITLPSSLDRIRTYTFSDCTALTSISIPASVTIIDSWAFEGCTGLATITSNKPSPVVLEVTVFMDVNKATCTLRVPTGSKTSYQAASNWNAFTNIVEF